MPAQPATAPCEVCGAEATTKCSSCAQVGIDLFFCSRDCQKLVWSSHKLVCGTGGRAGPIKVPEISAEEIEALKSRADQ
ncbi:Zinc finger, MYND-type protein [Rhodotorula toruloides]|nr:Zinc finger, MYND-type protein [Rhodotorula toruloides]